MPRRDRRAAAGFLGHPRPRRSESPPAAPATRAATHPTQRRAPADRRGGGSRRARAGAHPTSTGSPVLPLREHAVAPGAPRGRARSRPGAPRSAPSRPRARRCRRAARSATLEAAPTGTARRRRATVPSGRAPRPSSGSSSAPEIFSSRSRASLPRNASRREGSPGGCVAAIGKNRLDPEGPPVEPLEEDRPRRDSRRGREAKRGDRVGKLGRCVGRLGISRLQGAFELEHADAVGLTPETRAAAISPRRASERQARRPRRPEPGCSDRARSGHRRPARRGAPQRRTRAASRTASARARRSHDRRPRRSSRSRRSARPSSVRSGSRTVRISAVFSLPPSPACARA